MIRHKLPKIDLPDTGIEKRIDQITILLLLSIFIFLGYCYPNLPDEIPTHFNVKGEVDKWGAKEEIWFLPILAVLLVGLMFLLYKIPHHYNYMKKITLENAPHEYRRSRLLLRMTSLTIVLIFSIIIAESCYVAMYQKTFLGVAWMVIIILCLGFFPLIYYLIKQK